MERASDPQRDLLVRSTAVLIVGGGPAAFATALRLAQHGVAFLLACRAPPARGYGDHLAAEALPLLHRLGAEALLRSPAHRPCPSFQVAWGSRIYVRRDLVAHPSGCSLVLDRAVFERDLALLLAPDRILTIAQFQNLEREGEHWRATFRTENGTLAVEAHLLVDATGRSAACARRAGARVRRGPALVALHHRGLPGTLRDDGGAFWIASGRDAWGYAVRLADGSAVSALIAAPGSAIGGAAFRAAAWREALAGLGLPLGLQPDAASGPPRPVPCGPQRLWPPAGPKWLAVGDAACAFDPVTGSGLVRALRSAVAGADAAALALDGDADALARHAAHETSAAATLAAEMLRVYRCVRDHRDRAFWQLVQLPLDLDVSSPRAAPTLDMHRLRTGPAPPADAKIKLSS